jgi:vancomycin permeability regulator SanA
MNTLHHLFSQMCSFVMVFSLTYLIMEYTIGFIPALRRWMLPGHVPGRTVLFGLGALLLVTMFVSFP